MTRINLVPPAYLMDQHCFAEWREIKMIPKSLRRSLVAVPSAKHLLPKIPKEFTLNKGHVFFFYDKGAYLSERYSQLTTSLLRRNYDLDLSHGFDDEGIFTSLDRRFSRGYIPTAAALSIIKQRLRESYLKQPAWYRYSEPAAYWPQESLYGEVKT